MWHFFRIILLVPHSSRVIAPAASFGFFVPGPGLALALAVRPSFGAHGRLPRSDQERRGSGYHEGGGCGIFLLTPLDPFALTLRQ